MSKVKEHDEQEALKLDEHFKRTLTLVKPYILNLRSVEEAHLCKIWLDKLNSTIFQRNLRNEYLLELFRQLRTGTLEGIFKTQPPNDSLMPLPSYCHAICISSSLSELSDYGKNYYNCLMLNGRSDQKNEFQNRIKFHDSNSTYTTSYMQCQNENIPKRNHLKFCKHRIDILTTALENFRIQNEGLKQELKKCQGKTMNNEVFQLRNYVKQLTAETQSQSLAWKIRVLKKTVARLRKLNNTIEHVYEKKLQRIIRNKNLEIKALQLQFQRESSEMCLSLFSEKQNELHGLVGSLEEKYKTLLTAADATIENQRQEYSTKIAALETELCHLKNNL